MICKVCGRTINEEGANFCEYCGTSVREMKSEQTGSSLGGPDVMNQQQAMYQQPSQQMYGQSQNYNQQTMYQQPIQQAQSIEQNCEKPMTFWNWMGIMLLPWIPFVGGLAYIVLLFVWAFGRETSKTKKNWARATLVVVVISIVFVVIFFVSAIGNVLNSGMTMQDYVNTYGTY